MKPMVTSNKNGNPSTINTAKSKSKSYYEDEPLMIIIKTKSTDNKNGPR